MAKFSELKVKFTGDSSALQAELRRVNASLAEASNSATRGSVGFARFADSLKNVGSQLSIGLTAPIVGFGAAALKMAGQMEQASVAFRTMLKSGTEASKMLGELKQFAATTPFQFTELTDAARRMLALGYTSKEVLPALRTIGDAAGALGLGAEGINRITLALGQMRAKGVVSAEEMRQLAEAGIPAWNALANTLGVTVAEAMKMVEARTVDAATGINAAMTAMRDSFGGGMEAQAKTLLGLWSNVKDAISFALADIGAALLPAAKAMVEKFIMPSIEGAKNMAREFSVLPQPIQQVAFALTGLAAAGGPAIWVLGQLSSSLLAVKELVVFLGPAMRGLSAVIRTLVPELAALSALVAIGYSGKKAWDEFTASVVKFKAGLFGAQAAGMVRETRVEMDKAGEAASKFEQSASRLGITTSKQLSQQLKEAKDHLVATNVAFQSGKASAEDLAAAQARVTQINAQLHPSIKQVTAALGELNGAIQGPRTQWQELMDELQRREISKATEDINKMADAWQRVEAVRSGQIRVEPITTDTSGIKLDLPIDWDWGAVDQERAVKRAKDGLKDLSIQYGVVLRDAKASMSGQSKALREVSTIITDMSRRITDVIFNGGKMKDVFVSVAKEIASALLRYVIQGAFVQLGKVILDSIGKLSGLGKVLSGIFGGISSAGSVASAGGSAAGSVAGSVAGTAGKIAGSAVTGIVGAVAGVVSAVSGVISNFQLARQETTLNAIEWNTRKTSLHAQDTLLKINEGIPGFGAVQQRIVEVRDLLVGWSDAVMRGSAMAATGYGVTINVTGSFIGYRDMDTFVDDLVRRIKTKL